MIIIAKILMTLSIGVYAFIPPLVDLLTDSHVFHPEWVAHARLHTVWLLGLTSSIGLICLYLIWFARVEKAFSINLAGVLSLVVYGAFFVSAFTAPFYGGSISARIDGTVEGPFGLDGNLLLFGLAFILLLAGWLIYNRNRRELGNP